MLGNRTKAWDAFQKALELTAELPDALQVQARCNYSLGCLLFDQQRLDEAHAYLARAQDSFEKFKTPPAGDLVR